MNAVVKLAKELGYDFIFQIPGETYYILARQPYPHGDKQSGNRNWIGIYGDAIVVTDATQQRYTKFEYVEISTPYVLFCTQDQK